MENQVIEAPVELLSQTTKSPSKKSLIIGIVIILILLIGIGFYFLMGSKNDSPVGLWSVEKAYSYDSETKLFTETPIDFSIYGGHIYMEFTKDGRWCSQWGEGTECLNYDNYTNKGNVMNMSQVDPMGNKMPDFKYNWKFTDGNLELIAEMSTDNGVTWSTLLKYTLNPAIK